MFVQVVHDVLDGPGWTKLATELQGQGGPSAPGLRLHTSVTAGDRSKVFCLWEVDSVDALRAFLDAATQDVLKNTYYPIDTSLPATNLPQVVSAR